MSIKKAYYFFFYKIYNFSKNVSDDALNDLKPGIIISVLQIFLLIEILVWYTIITKGDVGADWYYKVVAILICGFNYYVFLYKNKWKNYFNEFKNYGKRKNIIGGWLTFITIIFIIVSLIFSFYQMSLVDWKQYR